MAIENEYRDLLPWLRKNGNMEHGKILTGEQRVMSTRLQGWPGEDEQTQGILPLEELEEGIGLPTATAMEDVKGRGNPGAWRTWGQLVFTSLAMELS